MEKLKMRRTIFIILNVIVVFCIILFMARSGRGNFIWMTVGFICVVLWILISSMIYYFWIKIPYKIHVIKPAIEKIHSGITYSHKGNGVEYKSIIKKYGLITLATTFRFSDVIKDHFEDISYTSMDLEATHTRSSGKSTTVVTDFKGKVYDILVDKPFCNFILKEGNRNKAPKGFSLVDVELIHFNERFDLYTTDKVEIYKIFTPKRIKECEELEFFSSKKSVICHIDNHLYIFLSNGENQFEKLTSEEEIRREYFMQLENLKKYLRVFKEF